MLYNDIEVELIKLIKDMNKKIVFGLMTASMILGITANAQNPNGRAGMVQNEMRIDSVRVEARAELASSTEAGNAIRTETRAELASSTAAFRNEVRQLNTERKMMTASAIASSTAVFREQVQKARQELQTKREEARAQLKVQLQVIKDDQKKAVVERLDKNINDLNVRFTDQWSNVLVKLDAYLATTTTEASALSVNGKDISAVTAAVNNAQTAIAAAKSAVEAQAQKNYTITVVNEQTLKANVSDTRNSLNTDLRSVKDLMLAAQQAVINAMNELNKIK
ncbi:MAG: hypothetical protein M1155_02920 [Patescibacteria group bacterium]|nr:hypothetical protein [Patescibacteria group bacterium]